MTQDWSREADSSLVLEAPVESPALHGSQRVRLGLPLVRTLLVLAIAVAMVLVGVKARQHLYVKTLGNRFTGDIGNAWSQGSAVLAEAQRANPNQPITLSMLLDSYLTRYDAVLAGSRAGIFRLDYPPARLLVMSLWVWQMNDRVSDSGLRPWNFAIAWPLLCANALFELAACAGAYLLVRHVLRRQNIRGADFVALIAPLLMWFNLAVLLDAHVWPQWEAWILPFYTFAAYFAATRRWLLVGLCIAVGALFKGQMLITAAIFVLWPLIQLRWRGVLEVAVGALLGAMIFAMPWMLRTHSAALLVGGVLMALLVAFHFVPRGWRVLYLSSGAGVALLAAGLNLGGSFAWWTVGFERGATQYMHQMHMGPTTNLAALLNHAGWHTSDSMLSLDWPALRVKADLTARQCMMWLYGIALVLCAIGVAFHDARNDRRMLIALATPWVVMFAFLAQMHERYLVWGAALTALAAGVSLGATLLHFVVTLLASIPLIMQLFNRGSGFGPNVQDWLDSGYRVAAQSFPDAGWATLLVALVFLYLSIAPSGRRASSARVNSATGVDGVPHPSQ
jgi:hypothetical protein